MSLKNKLATLEQAAKAQAPKDRVIFCVIAGEEKPLIAWKSNDACVMRLPDETEEALQKRAGDIALSKRTHPKAVCFLRAIYVDDN